LLVIECKFKSVRHGAPYGRQLWIIAMRLLGLILATLLIFPVAGHAATRDTVVVIVRHAEKATDDPKDPSLSEAGVARAQALAKALANLPLSAAYATQYRRTQLTAKPAADAAGIQVQIRPVDAANSATYGADLAAIIRNKHRGRNVLVVGHSNTVPDIVKSLSGVTIEEIGESEFDRVYVVTLDRKGGAQLLSLRY
jgi:broad specificity phosphatase PhoE